MKNITIYLIAFFTTLSLGLGTIFYLSNTPYKTKIITLENDYKTVKLYGMSHIADESFYKEVFKDFKEQEKDHEIITEGYETFATAEGKIVELNLFSKIFGCDYLKIEHLNFTKQADYYDKNKLNYTKYLKDINIYQMYIMAPKEAEKNYICFEANSVKKLRVYFKLNHLIQKNSLKHSTIYNRDINLVNEILLSPKQKVAVYYGDQHLNFTTELLEKVGFKVKKIEYINAF